MICQVGRRGTANQRRSIPMAKYMLQQSLLFVRPSLTAFIYPGRLQRWSTANSAGRQNFSTSTSPITSSPCLLLPTAPADLNNSDTPQDEKNSRIVHQFYSLREKRVVSIDNKMNSSQPEPEQDAFRIGSYNGWVSLINQRPNFDIFISDPVTGHNINLSSAGLVRLGPKIVAISDPLLERKFLLPCLLIKGVIMSSPDPDSEDCRALVRIDIPFIDPQRLAFCCPSDRNDNASPWTILDSPFTVYFDSVYSPKDHMFFAMDKDFQIESWDLSDNFNPKRYAVVIGEKGVNSIRRRVENSRKSAIAVFRKRKYLKRYTLREKYYLVADPSLRGQLFLVYRCIAHDVGQGLSVDPDAGENKSEDDRFRYRNAQGFTILTTPEVGEDSELPYKTLTFHVWKIDTTARDLAKPEYMESLDDRALFVGSNGGFGLSANDFPELKPNSIYFTDDVGYHPGYNGNTFGGHDIGIYNYKNQKVEECYYPVDREKYERIQPSPIWFTPHYV